MSPSNPFTSLSTHPISPRPKAPISLTSLPIEVIRRITSFLDRSSLLAFARLSRSLNPLTTQSLAQSIWEALDISFDSTNALSTQSTSEEVESANRVGLRTKVETILRRCSPSKLRLVKFVRITVRPGSLHSIVQLLGYVSSTLEDLEIHMAPGARLESWEERDTIDCRLIRHRTESPVFGRQFSALTCLTLGRRTILHHRFLWWICQQAPRLEWLSWTCDMSIVPPEASFAQNVLEDYDFTDLEIYVQTLKLDFVNRGTNAEYARESIREMTSFIRACEWLQQLSIRYSGPDGAMDAEDSGGVFVAVAEHEYLRDVQWRGTSMTPGTTEVEWVDDDGWPELSVARLVMDHAEWGFPGTSNHVLPHSYHLCTIHFDTTLRTGPPSFFIDRSSDAQLIPPKLAAWLHVTPHLANISFFCSAKQQTNDNYDIFPLLDTIEEETGTSGHVYSYKHGDTELLHVRLLLQEVEMPPADSSGSPERSSVIFAAYDDKLAEHVDRVLGVYWQDFTVCQGTAIPLSVLRKMRKAEGMSVRRWKRRGVEVGDAAWEVLEMWAGGLVEGDTSDETGEEQEEEEDEEEGGDEKIVDYGDRSTDEGDEAEEVREGDEGEHDAANDEVGEGGE